MAFARLMIDASDKKRLPPGNGIIAVKRIGPYTGPKYCNEKGKGLWTANDGRYELTEAGAAHLAELLTRPGVDALYESCKAAMEVRFLISYTRVDTEGTEFKPEEIWRASVLRLHNKIISRHEYLQDRANKQVRLGKNTHPLDSETHCQPLAHFESEDRETVQVSYSTPYRALMATVDITLP